MMLSKLKLWLVLTTCFLFVGGAIFGQRQISGTVTDAENSEALIGATISVAGAAAGTVTDYDGNFKINLPPNATQLTISYTGFETQTIDLTASNVLKVALKNSALIKEVVVIGYGTVKREDATGLVQSVSSNKFNRGAITGPQELMAGKIAGVAITSNNGAPGGAVKIRIRGESSLGASNDPLIVVDGIPLDNPTRDGNGISGGRNQLNFLNPNDIETFTVLKDASAAAIYGNRASGGVILITTKKGKLGKKIQVGLNTSASFSYVAKKMDVLTGDEFRATVKNFYANPDPTGVEHPAIGLLGTANTDWQDEIFQEAPGNDHNLNISGGIGVVPYRVSIGYTEKEGILRTDNFNRYSSAVNLSPGFFNNTLQFNVNFKGMLSKNHFADNGAIGNALGFDPTRPVRDTSAKFGGFTTWTIANGNPNNLGTRNPVAALELRDDNSTVKQYISSASVDYRFKFLPALRANVNVGYSYTKGEGTIVVPNFAAFEFDAINGGGVNNYYEQTKKNSLLESYLNYKKEFGDHIVDVMAGYGWQHFDIDNYFKNSDTKGTPSEITTGSDPKELFMISLFGRLNYTFKDRYLLTGSLRRDATSRFGPDFRWGYFPAAAFAVKILDNDKRLFNNLKLRLSWGRTGQQDLGEDYYPYLAQYQYGNTSAQYQFGDSTVTTIRPNGYVGNLKWEETDSYNAGLDFSIIKNRLSGSFDLYKKQSIDLLSYVPFSALSNLTNYLTTNIGKLEGEGVELTLNLTPVLTKKVQWDLAFNVARNTSKITKLNVKYDPNDPGQFVGGISGGVGSNIQVHSVGYTPFSFYVFEQKYDATGRFLEGEYVDRNGDGLVNEADKYRFKSPAPLYVLGMSSSLNIKSFTLSFAGRAHLGNYVYNNTQTDMGYLNRIFGTTKVLWNVNQSAVDLQAKDQAKLTFSDHFVTDASFFRLDHITASYNFQHLVGRYFNVYTTVQNPFVITNYGGIDPEIGSGIDNSFYPRSRTFVIGLNVNF